MRRRDPRATGPARWALVGALALVLAGCATAGEGELPQNTLDPAGPVAQSQGELWNIVFLIAVGVFILVQGLLLVAIFRFRAKRTDDPAELPKQFEGNTRLELAWTVVPALILVGVAIPTVQTIFELSGAPDDALHVRVVGKQYWWEFEYLDANGERVEDPVVTANELHIPTGQPVYLHMESLGQQSSDPTGVIHSFWVPRLAGKQDVVPGHVRRMTIEADEPGTYPGQCAEFCGLSHANMRFEVTAQEQGEFEQWMEEQAAPAESGLSGAAAEGERLFTDATCIACHAIRGYETGEGQLAEARVGPDLTHLMSRDVFAGATFETNEENLRDWLADPPGMKPGSQMPDLNLSDEQIDQLVAYLQTLE